MGRSPRIWRSCRPPTGGSAHSPATRRTWLWISPGISGSREKPGNERGVAAVRCRTVAPPGHSDDGARRVRGLGATELRSDAESGALCHAPLTVLERISRFCYPQYVEFITI